MAMERAMEPLSVMQAIALASCAEDLEAVIGGARPPETAVTSPVDLTVAQVADRFERSPLTVRDWIRAKKLRAYKLNDREYRITSTALAEFVERQRNGGFECEVSREPPALSKWREE